MAGLMGMLTDAAVAAIVSKFGGNLLKGKWDDQLLGGSASSAMGQGVNLFNALPTAATFDFPLQYAMPGLVKEEMGPRSGY